MSLKDKVSLSTDAGTNGKSALWLAMGAIYQMPEGTPKHVLLGIWLCCMVAINYFMRGSGLSKDESDALVGATENIQEVLDIGRK